MSSLELELSRNDSIQNEEKKPFKISTVGKIFIGLTG